MTLGILELIFVLQMTTLMMNPFLSQYTESRGIHCTSITAASLWLARDILTLLIDRSIDRYRLIDIDCNVCFVYCIDYI